MGLWPRSMRRLVVAASATLLIGQPLAGQNAAKTAKLKGVVRDRSTGTAIRRAEIILLSDSRAVLSDSAGAFVFAEFPAGVSQLLIRALNFPALGIIVELAEGQVLDRPVVLDSTAAGRAAQELPTVAVHADAPAFNYRMTEFERRRHTGRGQYVTEDEIVKSGAYSIADAIKHMRGVDYRCEGTGCYVRMFRAPMRCLPEYIVDGRAMNDFGPTTPIRDIIGLEVYAGPADVPGEFAGTNAGCGVVVVWTRSGPTPRKPQG